MGAEQSSIKSTLIEIARNRNVPSSVTESKYFAIYRLLNISKYYYNEDKEKLDYVEKIGLYFLGLACDFDDDIAERASSCGIDSVQNEISEEQYHAFKNSCGIGMILNTAIDAQIKGRKKEDF